MTVQGLFPQRGEIKGNLPLKLQLIQEFKDFNREIQDYSYHILPFLQKIVVTHILIFVYVTECKNVISKKYAAYPKITADVDNCPSENLV